MTWEVNIGETCNAAYKQLVYSIKKVLFYTGLFFEIDALPWHNY